MRQLKMKNMKIFEKYEVSVSLLKLELNTGRAQLSNRFRIPDEVVSFDDPDDLSLVPERLTSCRPSNVFSPIDIVSILLDN